MLFSEWVIFCDLHSGTSVTDSCRFLRTLSTEIESFVSFHAYLTGTVHSGASTHTMVRKDICASYGDLFLRLAYKHLPGITIPEKISQIT